MGKKRGRAIGSRGNAGVIDPTESSAVHAQTFVDEVRESRDVEFAAELKGAEKAKRRKVAKGRKGKGAILEDEEAEGKRDVVDVRTTDKILKVAAVQRRELREEREKEIAVGAAEKNREVEEVLRGVGERSNGGVDGGSSDASEEEDGAESTREESEGGMSVDEQELDFLDGSKITADDELALAMFSNMDAVGGADDGRGGDLAEGVDNGPPRIMLADIILAKIREKEEADAHAAAVAADPERAERDQKIAQVYGLVGNIMSRYRSGKVPKAFKVIPKLSNWEDILYLTRPDEWTSASVYMATRLLASNLSAKQVVTFYSDILLPRCLEDIAENKKLNYHLYRALGKAVYKPDAFNKGILFPLCEDDGCTLRQATIIGSVLTKVSIPMLHSAATLLYIAQLAYSPANSIIITALLDKKYALPYRVIDALVQSFVQMKRDERQLPMLWHKSLLTFAQRYKMELTMEQKDQLKLLMRVHFHQYVTPEIRRELFSARNRGDLMEPDSNTVARAIANAALV